MKRTKATRYVGLDARSAAELGDLLTAKCEELREFKPEIVWNLGNGNSAFLVYDELFEEPENLLKQELREPAVYNSIITAIAGGASRANEIATKVGIESAKCAKYLNVLLELGILQKETPMTEKPGRKTIYTIKDQFFRFWYRFVPRNMTAISSGRIANVYDRAVKAHLHDHMGLAFEEICKEYLLYYADNLPIELSDIEPNPNQPRREFDQEALQELANSIREIGIIQPITLRQADNGKYQIIAGERRWRAAQMAGLESIPAYIRTINDENVMEMALVENIQREDLNAIEIALAYQHLVETSGLTQERIADRVGKSRTAVTNYLRLLKLPAQVQMALQEKTVDMGHARALLSLDSPALQIKVFREIEKNGYSVRKVEEMVKQLKSGETVQIGKKRLKSHPALSEEYNELRAQLSKVFSTKVEMTCSPKGKGKISIPFANEDELEQILRVLDRLKNE